MDTLLLSPPIALGLFLLLAYGIYRLGGRLAATGDDYEGKFTPYTGGEDLPPPTSRLPYHAFFRLALMFAILHVAALVASTLPLGMLSHRTALLYLAGIGISVLVLTDEGKS